jgi:RecA/RadA recombinase
MSAEPDYAPAIQLFGNPEAGKVLAALEEAVKANRRGEKIIFIDEVSGRIPNWAAACKHSD